MTSEYRLRVPRWELRLHAVLFVIAAFLKDRLRSYNEDDKTPLTGDLREPFTFELTQYLIDEEQRELKEQQQAQATPVAVPPAQTPNPESPIPSAPAAPTTTELDSSAPVPQTPATSLSSSPVSAFCIQHSEFPPNVLKRI